MVGANGVAPLPEDFQSPVQQLPIRHVLPASGYKEVEKQGHHRTLRFRSVHLDRLGHGHHPSIYAQTVDLVICGYAKKNVVGGEGLGPPTSSV